MSFEVIDSICTIKADSIMTVAMAAVLLLIGFFIKSKVKFLDKYCIPAPVVGGFLFMFITFIGHITGTFSFSFDSMYQAPFMLAFFTTVGLGASISLLKKGGVLLFFYWLIAGVVSVFQNIICKHQSTTAVSLPHLSTFCKFFFKNTTYNPGSSICLPANSSSFSFSSRMDVIISLKVPASMFTISIKYSCLV